MQRPADKAFALATLLALAGASLAGPCLLPVRAQPNLLAQASGAAPVTSQPALSIDQARAAANEILKA